jgi:hypothetical protein
MRLITKERSWMWKRWLYYCTTCKQIFQNQSWKIRKGKKSLGHPANERFPSLLWSQGCKIIRALNKKKMWTILLFQRMTPYYCGQIWYVQSFHQLFYIHISLPKMPGIMCQLDYLFGTKTYYSASMARISRLTNVLVPKEWYWIIIHSIGLQNFHLMVMNQFQQHNDVMMRSLIYTIYSPWYDTPTSAPVTVEMSL